jgi:hypothetical protein
MVNDPSSPPVSEGAMARHGVAWAVLIAGLAVLFAGGILAVRVLGQATSPMRQASPGGQDAAIVGDQVEYTVQRKDGGTTRGVK